MQFCKEIESQFVTIFVKVSNPILKKKKKRLILVFLEQWKPHNSNCAGMDKNFELRGFDLQKRA